MEMTYNVHKSVVMRDAADVVKVEVVEVDVEWVIDNELFGHIGHEGVWAPTDRQI